MTLAIWFDIAEALVKQDKRSLAFSPLDPANRPLFIKLGLVGYLNSAVLAEMRRDPGLPIRLQQICTGVFEHADPNAQTVAGRAGQLNSGAVAQIQKKVEPELPLVGQAALDPALWRALRLDPNLAPIPDKVADALRWFRTASHVGH